DPKQEVAMRSAGFFDDVIHALENALYVANCKDDKGTIRDGMLFAQLLSAHLTLKPSCVNPDGNQRHMRFGNTHRHCLSKCKLSNVVHMCDSWVVLGRHPAALGEEQSGFQTEDALESLKDLRQGRIDTVNDIEVIAHELRQKAQAEREAIRLVPGASR